MSDRAYRDIYYEDPVIQAQFDQMLGRIYAAEQARAPIAERHSKAERASEEGGVSDAQFTAVDDEYIAANNAIAAAQRAVDEFLATHRNYKTR